MIIKCNCSSTYQDDKYGDKMRVANKVSKPDTYRCTVCSKEIRKEK